MRRICVWLVVWGACGLSVYAKESKDAKVSTHARSLTSSKILPVTASSAKARDLFERAMVDYENLHLGRATTGCRAAAKEDPDLALAHAWVAFNSRDPQEVMAERERAKGLLEKVTPGERLMIHWIANVQEGKFIPGIAAMNDMLAMYPKDKRLLYLAGNWLMGENGNEPAQKMFERALSIDKNYPAALNDIAYVYARNRQFEKAFEAMDRYVAVLPTEPNPHDSYGELLRMAGNFDGALHHYRMALKIDPEFVTSQLGLGDTYALMGNQEQARIEYDKAVLKASGPVARLEYTMQKALTLLRENNLADADKTFTAVAEEAHTQNLPLAEAQAHRRMAGYQTDANEKMHLVEARLRGTNVPTLEQALVVPAARSRRPVNLR